MIDPLKESLVSLSEACRLVPRRRAGKKCNVATIYRWTAVGIRGVRLESIQIGGSRCTSKEALSRFFAALTCISDPAAPIQLPAARRREIERAERAMSEGTTR